MSSRIPFVVAVGLALLVSIPAQAACQRCTGGDPWASHCEGTDPDYNGWTECSDLFGCSVSGESCTHEPGSGDCTSDPDGCKPFERTLIEVPELSHGQPWILDGGSSCDLPRQIIEA